MRDTFMARLQQQWADGRHVCVGLDSAVTKLPGYARGASVRDAIVHFNEAIIDATSDLVAAYKPNIAFYEMCGPPGLEALAATIRHVHDHAPGVPVILDAKRGDNETTNRGYVTAIFDELGADAVTVHPFLGEAALQPFLDRKERGIFVLCRTSNASAPEFQDLDTPQGKLYEVVARHVANDWNVAGNCGLVVGATYPGDIRRVRQIAPTIPLLIPGVGAQGGALEATVAAATDGQAGGFLVSASRSVIFASRRPDFAIAARNETLKLHDAITSVLPAKTGL